MKKQITYRELLDSKAEFDATGVTNPHLFKWEEKNGKYFPVNFSILPINVYRFPLGDCTAGGISSTTDTIYIPCEDCPWLAIGSGIDQNLILVPEQRGPHYWAVKPADSNRPEFNGPMAGGNLAYSSDSRCKYVYHIHDRFEKW